jgi:hypothetical protein
MDGNYEAQKHFTNQRLAARREQAAVERALREGRSAQNGRLKQFFLTLFRRSGSPEKHNAGKPAPSARLAISGKGKR